MDTKLKKSGNRIKSFFIERMEKAKYADVRILIGGIILYETIFFTLNWLFALDSDGNEIYYGFFCLLVSVMGLAATGVLLVPVWKMWKSREISAENSIFYVMCRWFFGRILGTAYYPEGVVICSRKRFIFSTGVISGVLLIGFYMLLRANAWSMDVMGLCMVVAFVLLILYHIGTKRILREYERLTEQFEEIRQGNYSEDYVLEEKSVFYKKSVEMSLLGSQLKETVEKQLQAERMKVDLITNVSHDLKTPLTSIISYIELLSKEEMNPVAKDYVAVLENKSQRLKKMIEDVFELAKATSGNVEIQREPLDVHKLLMQTLADMADTIENAPVKVVEKIPEKPVMMESDGQKLYRVLQNLIGNALQYAMPNTRVYVTLQSEKEDVQIRIKNVSGYEMNFTEEEILGRFVRGDKSRSTPGSGLGLAIAREFTEICGGTLKVMIDGDVFEVGIAFPVPVKN